MAALDRLAKSTMARAVIVHVDSPGGTTAGSYVSIDGYLFGGGSGAANVVATLVSVHDVPTGTGGAFYKVEGVVTAIASNGLCRITTSATPSPASLDSMALPALDSAPSLAGLGSMGALSA